MNPMTAYANSAGLQNIGGSSNLTGGVAGSVAGGAAAIPTGGTNFADLVADASQNGLNAGRQAEGLSANVLNGNANLTDVVTAVSNAEVTLQTVVSIRDRLVNGIQEIMRMPI